MVRITEELVRKRAEHNEGEIFSLEELTLHQQDIEKIENLDKWCRELKVLYLQSNLIGKIENVGRLKKLEYLNLALNNIEIIENLENCESLKKLDLTVNFIGILTSVQTLVNLYHFEELYLTGNPCQSYDGYREFVIATLPQLKTLDGTEVTKSERIRAIQTFSKLHELIEKQENEWIEKRILEKEEAIKRKERRKEQTNETGDNPNDDPFWNEKVPFTPESRWETHDYLQEKRKREQPKQNQPEKIPRKLFADDGRPYNVNEAKIDFSFTDEDKENCFKLDIALYKYMDTSLVDCDVQTNYVRVIIKGKILQLALPEEIRPDESAAVRSETTGHLVIIMPKMKEMVKPQINKAAKTKELVNNKENAQEKLHVDWRNIVQSNDYPKQNIPVSGRSSSKFERPNNSDFVDNPDVPPLE